jgi:hypothetical protein
MFGDFDNNYRDVVGPTSQIRQIDQDSRRQIRAASTTKEGRFRRLRAGRSDRRCTAGNDRRVLIGNGPSTSTSTLGDGPSERVMMFLGIELLSSLSAFTWPEACISHTRAVVERQLLQLMTAKPIDTAVTDMRD